MTSSIKEFQLTRARISAIRQEPNTEKRLEMLLRLNNSLPKGQGLKMPSLITNAYVRRALDLLEEKIPQASRLVEIA